MPTIKGKSTASQHTFALMGRDNGPFSFVVKYTNGIPDREACSAHLPITHLPISKSSNLIGKLLRPVVSCSEACALKGITLTRRYTYGVCEDSFGGYYLSAATTDCTSDRSLVEVDLRGVLLREAAERKVSCFSLLRHTAALVFAAAGDLSGNELTMDLNRDKLDSFLVQNIGMSITAPYDMINEALNGLKQYNIS